MQSGTGVPLLSNLPAAATSGLAFLIQPGGDVLLDAIVTAAEASGRAKLLSSPRITTQNNQPATVSQGTQIPVQTNVNNTVTTSFIDFSLNLTVTPQITAAGTILLTVALENSVPDFARSVNSIPSVASQKAKTQVLIPDGGTAVIGGIYVDTDSMNVRQVPGFGSIPILGYLFKETVDDQEHVGIDFLCDTEDQVPRPDHCGSAGCKGGTSEVEDAVCKPASGSCSIHCETRFRN